MKQIKNILLPTDFSDNASNALRYGIELAKKFNAKLFILNVYHIPLHNPDGAIFSDEELTKETINAKKEEFKKLKNNFLGLTMINYDTILEHGLAVDVILDKSKELNIDLIIMGTRGASGIAKVLLGSNTATVVSKAECPVLAIPKEASFKPFKEIALATDYEKTDQSIFETLIYLANAFEAKVHIVNVNEDISKVSVEEATTGMKLHKTFNQIEHSYYMINDEEVEEGLEEYIEEKKIDLLVMIPKKHTIFERLFRKSHTKEMVYQTKIPLLTLNRG